MRYRLREVDRSMLSPSALMVRAHHAPRSTIIQGDRRLSSGELCWRQMRTYFGSGASDGIFGQARHLLSDSSQHVVYVKRLLKEHQS